MTIHEEPPSLEELHQTCQSLRKMIQALAIVMIVLSASLNIYLLRQVTQVRRELSQRQRILTQYEEKGYPLLVQFLGEMGDYARNEPAFAAIYGKYFPIGESPREPPENENPGSGSSTPGAAEE